MPALSNHGHLQVAERFRRQFVKPPAGKAFADRNLSHVEALRLGGKFRLHELRHEVDAEDGADDAEGIGDGVADRGILVLDDVERGLEGCGAGHRTGIDAERMSDLDAEDVPQAERDQQARQTGHQRQQIVLLPGADHPLEELAAIEDADPVEKHDQARQADRPGDLGLWCERADGEADEENRADAKRETEDVDLANKVAQSDRQERGQNWLASDDLASKVQHV